MDTMMTEKEVRRRALERRVRGWLSQESFLEGIARGPDGGYRVIVGDWEDTVGDVLGGIDLFGYPATLLLPRGDEGVLGITLWDPMPAIHSGRSGAKVFGASDSLREFVSVALDSDGVYLDTSELYEHAEKKAHQLQLDIFSRVAA